MNPHVMNDYTIQKEAMSLSPFNAICQFIPPFMRYLREGLAGLNMSPARFRILAALRR